MTMNDDLREQLVDQKYRAAEMLFVNGHEAEGLRLARAAYALEASDGAEALLFPPDLPEISLDGELTPRHVDVFRTALRAHRRARRRLASGRTRFRWLLSVVVLALGLVAGGLWSARDEAPPLARASAAWDMRYGPGKANDGFMRSEWLLPDATLGWWELTLDPPRDVRRVRLLNARNLPTLDRSTSSYRLTLHSGEEVVAEEGAFPALDGRKQWAEHEVGLTEVSRVRIEILGFHEKGAGLAEVEID